VVAVVLAGVAVVHLWVPSVVPAYRLPWASGVTHTVMQGNYVPQIMGGCASGCGTHNDDAMRFALDFDLPEGTQVLAARGGTVALMNGNWRSDHCGGINAAESGTFISEYIGNQANFVEIAHGDGTSALYLHLSEVAPAIQRKAVTGEPVLQGELLGLSGKTGYTQCVPHLHFQVENSVRADWFTTSLPTSFADPDVVSRTPLGVPEEGQSYVSSNTPLPIAL
jgi:murein DD-endopeptidase MepM/ murein hydrolase activator NlpD